MASCMRDHIIRYFPLGAPPFARSKSTSSARSSFRSAGWLGSTYESLAVSVPKKGGAEYTSESGVK